jgi:hypothetical protein
MLGILGEVNFSEQNKFSRAMKFFSDVSPENSNWRLNKLSKTTVLRYRIPA